MASAEIDAGSEEFSRADHVLPLDQMWIRHRALISSRSLSDKLHRTYFPLPLAGTDFYYQMPGYLSDAKEKHLQKLFVNPVF